MSTVRPPAWFRIAVVLLILWGLAGVVMFHLSLTESFRAGLNDYDRSLYEEAPAWYAPVYGLAVWTGLIGSVLLALRRRFARSFFLVSLIAIVVMFGWEFAMTDLIAVKGVATATGFPIFIVVLAAFEIWLAGHAARRGWIG